MTARGDDASAGHAPHPPFGHLLPPHAGRRATTPPLPLAPLAGRDTPLRVKRVLVVGTVD
jgi:hypothetical protein